jgi:hypothetical protein
MALSPEEQAIVANLRKKVAEPTTATYTDDAILAVYATEGSVAGAAAAIWQEKAGVLADLVNTSESGSSRSLGDLYKNALAFAKFYADQIVTPIEEQANTAPFTVEVTRA